MTHIAVKEVRYYCERFAIAIEYKTYSLREAPVWRVHHKANLVMVRKDLNELPSWFRAFDKAIRERPNADWRMRIMPAFPETPCPT